MSHTALASPAVVERAKFQDAEFTADGQRRAEVRLDRIETLWFNTGTLCNLTCENCYIESSPTNDRLVYLSAAEVAGFLDELDADWRASEVGFTGGEPFMNRDLIAMLGDALGRGYRVLVLSNAMRPMLKQKAPLLALKERYGERLAIRVSVDHYTPALHETERGAQTWGRMLEGLTWLAEQGFNLAVAGRTFGPEDEAHLRQGYARFFAENNLTLDAMDPADLILFPEMDLAAAVPEITETCWDLLGVAPEAMMCASSRMVVKRKGEASAKVLPCTLLPYDQQFEMGHNLAEATGAVKLNHPHCAKFCVLGGGSCSAAE